MERKKISFPGYSRVYNCVASVDSYAVDRSCFAVQLWDEDGPVATITKYLGKTGARNRAFVDINNNPTIPWWMEKTGLGRFVEKDGRPVCRVSGMAVYPLYEFNEDLLEELDPEGWHRFCESYEE